MVAPEELRRRALGSAHAEDPWVARALRTGDLWLSHGVARWESSDGSMLGHRVGIGLDAGVLGHVLHDPHVLDALTIAVAEGFASLSTEVMTELHVHWSGATRDDGAYRDGLHDADIGRAIASYLDASGERDAVALLARCRVTIERPSPARVVATMTFTERVPRAERGALSAIERALTTLLGGAERARVRVLRRGA